MQSKEELKVLESAIFKGFYEQNFIMATDALSDNPDADLNQAQEILKLVYFKSNMRYTQMKVMRKQWYKLKEISL